MGGWLSVGVCVCVCVCGAYACFSVLYRRDFIKVENKSRITTKFGPDANNFSAPEISGYQQFHPPAEFTQEPDPNTPVVSCSPSLHFLREYMLAFI